MPARHHDQLELERRARCKAGPARPGGLNERAVLELPSLYRRAGRAGEQARGERNDRRGRRGYRCDDHQDSVQRGRGSRPHAWFGQTRGADVAAGWLPSRSAAADTPWWNRIAWIRCTQPVCSPRSSLNYDALAETVIGIYKTELVTRHGPWRDRDHLELATIEYIGWYNHERVQHVQPDEITVAGCWPRSAPVRAGIRRTATGMTRRAR